MKRFLLLAAAGLLLSACPGPAHRVPPPVTLPPAGPEVIPPLVVPEGALVPVLWAVPAAQDPAAAAEFLKGRPDLRVTALLPERYFGEGEAARSARALFAGLVSQGRLEIVLTLPNRPVLPLIHDTDLAKLSTGTASAPLPPRFHRPEDAAGQVALAKSLYRRRWKTSPAGLAVPWGAAVGPELEPLARMGFKWVYLGSKSEPGLYDAGGLMAVAAAPWPSKGDAAARRNWLRARFTGDDPPRFKTAVLAETPAELEALAGAVTGAGAHCATVGEWAASGPRPSQGWNPSDLSPWIGEPEENRAWQLLGVARQAFEDFKNSGRADVQVLDRATREMYGAENGSVFQALGSDGSPSRASEVKREFLASLEQVFRFLGAPPPAAVRQGFSGGDVDAGSDTAPFFRREGAALLWRDDAKDDRGPGDYFYPTGAVPPGAWDLRSFRVEPRASEVVFRAELASLANPGQAPYGFSLELLDVYIDINHLPGAGSESLLPGRPGLVETQDAWEYALSVDGWGARLYQPVPGGAPRRMAVLPVKVIPPSTVEVSVPRRYVRGEPDSWGLAVAVMGRAPSSPEGGEPSPMPVAEEPGPDRFGGAVKGRAAFPYVDLLTEGTLQHEALDAYKQGRDAVLPFVRADQQ